MINDTFLSFPSENDFSNFCNHVEARFSFTGVTVHRRSIPTDQTIACVRHHQVLGGEIRQLSYLFNAHVV